jgi:hypothetical protein
MTSRLLPLSLALGAVLADVAGAHQLAGLALLVAIPCAVAPLVVAVSDVAWGRALGCGGSLLLLLVGSAVRHGAPVGAAIPPVALSAVIAAAILYLVPAFFWFLQPVSFRAARAVPTP